MLSKNDRSRGTNVYKWICLIRNDMSFKSSVRKGQSEKILKTKIWFLKCQNFDYDWAFHNKKLNFLMKFSIFKKINFYSIFDIFNMFSKKNLSNFRNFRHFFQKTKKPFVQLSTISTFFQKTKKPFVKLSKISTFFQNLSIFEIFKWRSRHAIFER